MDTGSFILMAATGIAVVALSYVLDHIWAAVIPARSIYLALRFPGIVLHECAHIAGCLLTGARIGRIVLFSNDGGSVAYSRPAIPYIGDVIISTAPLFLLPLSLCVLTVIFTVYGGCTIPAFPATVSSPEAFFDLCVLISGTFADNLAGRFNGWFLLFLYLTVSIVLSAAPSVQDMKNAAAGSILLLLLAGLVALIGIPPAVSALEELVRLLSYGFTLGLVYGLVALFVSLPPVAWYAFRHRS